MDKAFIKRSVFVWLEMEEITTWAMQCAHTPNDKKHVREQLAEDLTNHLANNWEMVERAMKAPTADCGCFFGNYCPH